MQTVSSHSVEAAASARVSIRKYTDQPISKQELEEIIQLAGKAPSAYNVQPWRFIVVTNPETKLKLQEATYGQTQVGSSAALIVLSSDIKDALHHLPEALHPGMPAERRAELSATIHGMFEAMGPEASEAWGRGQSYIALGYLLLVLESKGLGSSPMLGFDPEQVKEILGISGHAHIPALIAVGHKNEDGFPQHRNPLSTILRFVD